MLYETVCSHCKPVKEMARKTRKDSSLDSALKKLGIKKSALKSKTGRSVRKDVKIGTLRKRSAKD